VIGLWIAVKKYERALHAVHDRPIEYQWIQNGKVSWYASRRIHLNI